MLNNINISYEKRKNNSRNKKPSLNKTGSSSKTKRKLAKTPKINYNIIVTKTKAQETFPSHTSLKNNNIINNININGDSISFSKNISYLINNHFNNNKLYISNIKLISESINEQTLFSRSATNDILLYLNQIVKPRFNGSMANINEKYIKDKIYQLNLRIEKITNLKNDLVNNIENNENCMISFYEEINNLLSNTQKDSTNHNNNNKNNKRIGSIDIQNIKDKYFEIYHKKNILTDINDITNVNNHNSSISIENENNKNNSVESKEKNDNIIKLSNMVLNFLRDMNSLQELIIKKDKNVKEFKKNFEISKHNLKKNCELYLKNNINFNNKELESIEIIKKEKKEIEKNLEEKNNEYNKLKNKIDELSKKNNELNNIIKNLDEQKKEIKEKNDKINEEIINEKIELNEKNIKLMNDIQLIKEENIKLKNAQNNNNKIIEENKEYLNKIKFLNEEINKIKNQNIENEKNLNLKIKEENLKLTNTINELNESNKQYKLLEEEKTKLSTVINKLEEQNKSLLLVKIKNNSNIKELNLELNDLKSKNNKNNEEIIKLKNIILEKDQIINDLNNKIKNMNLNEINISAISGNNKEFKFNNLIFDEEIDNIKIILNDLNINTKNNITKMIEKDNQFNEIKNNYNKKINEIYNENYLPINDIIKDINNSQNEYNKLIDQFKNNNNIFFEINKN